MRWCSARGCTFTPDELPLVSSGRTLVAFDVCFFATYAVGWFVTAVFNRGGLEDNGIARVFRVYNICIGVDTMPARLVCIPLSYLSIFFFMLTVILAAHRVTYEPGVWKALRLLLLLTAMLLATMFTWSIGIEPVGVENMRLHVTGFGLGLIGYGLLKLSSVLEFLHFTDGGLRACCSSARNAVFVSAELATAVFVLLFSGMFVFAVLGSADETIQAALDAPVPTDVQFDYTGLPLILVTAINPPIAMVFGPRARIARLSLQYLPVQQPSSTIAVHTSDAA